MTEQSKPISTVAPETRNEAPQNRALIKRTLKNCLPKFLVEEIQSYRRFKKNERPTYMKLRVLDAVGMGNAKRKAPSTARSFLFVCFGNIMRSPMCEALIKRELAGAPGIKVVSAGLHASPGNTAHPWAIAAARELGISLDGHRAQLLTPAMVDQADAIFAMDYQNEVELLTRYPHARNKILMLAAYAGDGYCGVEISDPYYGDPERTRACYEILAMCIENLVASGLVDSSSRSGRKVR